MRGETIVTGIEAKGGYVAVRISRLGPPPGCDGGISTKRAQSSAARDIQRQGGRNDAPRHHQFHHLVPSIILSPGPLISHTLCGSTRRLRRPVEP